MPRRSRGPYLWLRPARPERSEAAVWLIRDGRRQISTGFGVDDIAEAEGKLADHIKAKYAPERRERPLSEIRVADVIAIYAADVAPGKANPRKIVERGERLLAHFGNMRLDQITGAECRAYAAWRAGKGRSNKGKGGGARRDLEDLRAAIIHHQKEGLHRGIVRVVLPEQGVARQRWMTRDEAAKLLWTCWRTREIQRGQPTDKYPLRHLCRFLILGLYTGSRPGAVLTASWDRGIGRSFIDLDRMVFHRHRDGAVETNKRQPTVRISPRLAAHLRRWKEIDGKRGYVVTFAGERILSVKTALASAVEKSGIDGGVTAYTLRHSAGSWLVNKGLPTRKVADFLGTSEEMVIRHYGHLAPDYQDEAADAIGRR